MAVKEGNTYFIRFNWDIFVFRNLPSFFPTLATAISTSSPFFSIYFFDWTSTSFFIACTVLFLTEKLMLPTISTSKTGLAWGILMTAEYSYYINCMEEFGFAMNFIVVIIGLSIAVTLHLSTTTKARHLESLEDR